MFDWLTAETLLMYDTFSQNVVIVTGAILGAIVSPSVLAVSSWF